MPTKSTAQSDASTRVTRSLSRTSSSASAVNQDMSDDNISDASNNYDEEFPPLLPKSPKPDMTPKPVVAKGKHTKKVVRGKVPLSKSLPSCSSNKESAPTPEQEETDGEQSDQEPATVNKDESPKNDTIPGNESDSGKSLTGKNSDVEMVDNDNDDAQVAAFLSPDTVIGHRGQAPAPSTPAPVTKNAPTKKKTANKPKPTRRGGEDVFLETELRLAEARSLIPTLQTTPAAASPVTPISAPAPNARADTPVPAPVAVKKVGKGKGKGKGKAKAKARQSPTPDARAPSPTPTLATNARNTSKGKQRARRSPSPQSPSPRGPSSAHSDETSDDGMQIDPIEARDIRRAQLLSLGIATEPDSNGASSSRRPDTEGPVSGVASKRQRNNTAGDATPTKVAASTTSPVFPSRFANTPLPNFARYRLTPQRQDHREVHPEERREEPRPERRRDERPDEEARRPPHQEQRPEERREPRREHRSEERPEMRPETRREERQEEQYEERCFDTADGRPPRGTATAPPPGEDWPHANYDSAAFYDDIPAENLKSWGGARNKTIRAIREGTAGLINVPASDIHIAPPDVRLEGTDSTKFLITGPAINDDTIGMLLRAKVLNTNNITAYYFPFLPDNGTFLHSYHGLPTDNLEIVREAFHAAASAHKELRLHIATYRDNMSDQITMEEAIEAVLETIQSACAMGRYSEHRRDHLHPHRRLRDRTRLQTAPLPDMPRYRPPVWTMPHAQSTGLARAPPPTQFEPPSKKIGLPSNVNEPPSVTPTEPTTSRPRPHRTTTANEEDVVEVREAVEETVGMVTEDAVDVEEVADAAATNTSPPVSVYYCTSHTPL
ncbi:hypothetical protein C8F01DRAFT_1076457 [Mycena amicta]|nr:hypothetical protein C8F01DRAFT_1076457 [Mycena amicta]